MSDQGRLEAGDTLRCIAAILAALFFAVCQNQAGWKPAIQPCEIRPGIMAYSLRQ
jgi:hypothetical protein